jgi:acyl-CoA thioesterase-2
MKSLPTFGNPDCLNKMTATPDQSLFNTEEIVQLLALQATGDDRFVGQSHFMGAPHVFGGQALGQALHAASATVEGRRPHSLHALFILPGDLRLPIEYEVERVRDGGTFSTRRVVATQEGKRIFVMSASFQTAEEGLSHQNSAPPMADPETLPSSVVLWQQSKVTIGWPFRSVPVDFRVAEGSDLFGGSPGSSTRNIWARTPIALPDDPQIHESLFAYVSDYGLLWTALQPHGISVTDPRLQIASLDHTIWFHRPFRMDEWLLFATESPNAAGGRGLCLVHVYNRQGVMVATVAQEGLIRLRE